MAQKRALRGSDQKPTASNKGAEPLFDFRSSEPPLRLCEICTKRFKDWMVSHKQWSLVPEKFQGLEICKEDYLRLVTEQGHDARAITFNDELWKIREKWWQEDQDIPPHHVKIDFGCELMWCEVLDEVPVDEIPAQQVGQRRFIVRMWSTSIFDKGVKRGVRFLAEWDQKTLHGVSGRPMLIPIHQLKGPYRKARTRRATNETVAEKADGQSKEKRRPT
jgi:hypothetical protein